MEDSRVVSGREERVEIFCILKNVSSVFIDLCRGKRIKARTTNSISLNKWIRNKKCFLIISRYIHSREVISICTRTRIDRGYTRDADRAKKRKRHGTPSKSRARRRTWSDFTPAKICRVIDSLT